MSSAVAIIPARGGSRRIPRKNMKLFHGRPIIEYSIQRARESGLFEQIIVTTDDEHIGNLALRQDGVTLVYRDEDMAKDEVGTQEVVGDCLNSWFSDYTMPEYTCCIYATSPMLTVSDLIRASQLVKLPRYDYVMSVGYPPLRDAAQFYFGKSWAFVDGEPLVGEKTGMVHIPQERVCDINTPEDWELAEQMYYAHIQRKRGSLE